LPASGREFCAPANIAENFSKLLTQLRIDEAQVFYCQMREKAAISSVKKNVWRVGGRNRDLPIRKLLQLETIHFGKAKPGAAAYI
jgi:hypothetical protein